MDDVFVRYFDLPGTIHSYVAKCKDGSYTIIINSRLSDEMQRLAYYHELKHINNGDYDKTCSADMIEIFAHGA